MKRAKLIFLFALPLVLVAASARQRDGQQQQQLLSPPSQQQFTEAPAAFDNQPNDPNSSDAFTAGEMQGRGATTALARIARRDESARWLLAGLALSLVGLAIQQSSIGSGAYFNHNDIFHTLQIAALWLFYRGAKMLEDR